MPNSAAEARAATSPVSTSSVVLGECLTNLALRLGQAQESHVHRPGDRIPGDALERLARDTAMDGLADPEPEPDDVDPDQEQGETGRPSCRDRAWQFVLIQLVTVSLTKKQLPDIRP